MCTEREISILRQLDKLLSRDKPDVSLPDENASVVDGLGHSRFEDKRLESSL